MMDSPKGCAIFIKLNIYGRSSENKADVWRGSILLAAALHGPFLAQRPGVFLLWSPVDSVLRAWSQQVAMCILRRCELSGCSKCLPTDALLQRLTARDRTATSQTHLKRPSMRA